MRDINNPDFQPSLATLKRWLSTRKKPLKANENELSGLYVTDGYEKDKALFIAAVIIEVFALVFIIIGGLLGGSSGLIWAVLTALFIVLFDILGVFYHHKQVGDRNLKRAIKEVDKNKRPDLELELSRTHWSTVVGWFFLILSTLMKIGSVFFFVIFANDIIFIALVALYVFVLYVHGLHSGYWYAESRRMKSLRNDYKAWAKSYALLGSTEGKSFLDISKVVKNHAQIVVSRIKSTYTFESRTVETKGFNHQGTVFSLNDYQGTSEPLHGIKVVVDCNLVYLEKNGASDNEPNSYFVGTYGFLDDRLISDFISTQSNSEKFGMAILLRRFQIEKF